MKLSLKNTVIDYLMINLGLIITAIGIGLFLVPGQIAAGGVSGVATIAYYVLKWPVGLTMLALNIPLFLIGLKIFGKTYGLKTLFGTIMLSVYIDFFRAVIPNSDHLIDFTKGGNMLLGPIFGGVIAGIGLGVVMKFGGSTGGTDIIAQIINKYFRIPMGYSIMIIDFLVLFGAATFFGLEKGLYAVIALYVTAISINKVFEGVTHSKMVYVISDEFDKIRDIILHDINKGGTGLSGNGLYTNRDKKVIMSVLKNKEIHELTSKIKLVDPNAFVIISEVYEVLGEGFKPFLQE